jgi:hypothetical protein
LLWLLCMPWSLGESTCGRVLLRALRIPRNVCKRGAHGPSLRSGLVFTFSHFCIDTCRVRAGVLWVPRILFFLSPASPYAHLFGYLPLAMLLLRALNACISFLLLIFLGCRQFCPVCLCSFCFASLWLTVIVIVITNQDSTTSRLLPGNCAPSACWCSPVVSSGPACSFCAPPCSTADFNLCSSVSLLHAAGV